ncbi:hypothetical protein LEP1GSC053_3012 [Leptospira interrogans serovar Muenchen str. Brem 129]|nr:hypothetical protein LEP1GSC053_3012 [Leptospira interrogans serovar Muenchen str. Brem 129]
MKLNFRVVRKTQSLAFYHNQPTSFESQNLAELRQIKTYTPQRDL